MWNYRLLHNRIDSTIIRPCYENIFKMMKIFTLVQFHYIFIEEAQKLVVNVYANSECRECFKLGYLLIFLLDMKKISYYESDIMPWYLYCMLIEVMFKKTKENWTSSDFIYIWMTYITNISSQLTTIIKTWFFLNLDRICLYNFLKIVCAFISYFFLITG